MKVTFSGFDGLDDFNRQLDRMQKNMEKLAKKKEIPFSELFLSSFMAKYTTFSSIEEFMQKGNFNITSQEDFESLPEHELSGFVANHTQFSTWDEMLSKASEEWLGRQKLL